MKETMNVHRYLIMGLILLLVSLAVTACAAPTTQLTTAPTDTGLGITATSATQTPASTWETYHNTTYGFLISYPEQGEVMEAEGGQSARIDLPFIEGTNLQEKYVQIDVLEDPEPCSSPLAQGYEPQALQSSQVTINGIVFLTASGEEGAAGSIYDWIAYSTAREDICVSIGFVLHAANPLNFSTPPPEFDKPSEAGVFMEILSTFTWTK